MWSRDITGGGDERTPILLADVAFRARAIALATDFELRLAFLDTLPDDALVGETKVIFFIDLLDLATARLLRRVAGDGILRRGRSWAFVVAMGQARHASVSQANALGATDLLGAERVAADLQQFLSIGGKSSAPNRAVEVLREAPGGTTILAVGDALAELFGNLSTETGLLAGEVAEIGAKAAESVAEVGAERWLDTVRSHHSGTFQHCLLVAGTSAAFAVHHRLDRASAIKLTSAAILHDIGKATIPTHILDKPSALNDHELALIKTHPVAGHAYLAKQVGIEPVVLDGVRHHHEALDGSGYPDGLRGGQISALTRLLTVCDIYSALVETRTYRPSRTADEAILVLVKMALENKVDYSFVRKLAQVFDMDPPEAIEDVKANLAFVAPKETKSSESQRAPNAALPPIQWATPLVAAAAK